MSMEGFGFSVIIPTYNRAYILKKAITSVYNQRTETDWELIIADDGSTDNTEELVRGFRDKRIKYLFQQNRGQSAARNLGLKHATKQWVVYLDSDNTLFPNYFGCVSQVIQDYPTMLYAMVRVLKTYELYENGKIIKNKKDRGKLLQLVTLQDLFFLKAIFDGNGFLHKRGLAEEIRWDEKLRVLDDWDFFMQIGERYPNNFVYIPEPVVDYRVRFGTDGILSNTTYTQMAEAFEYVYQKHKNDKLLQGQTWYPAKVHYYIQRQKDFEAGKVPPHMRRYLRD